MRANASDRLAELANRSGTVSAFRGTERFRLVERLGQGAMGVVYEAVDREHNVHLALKTLPVLDPDSILLFKHEFRSLSDIQHRNLVSLGELVEHGGQWFFTMELVRGVDFLTYVRTVDAGIPARNAPSMPPVARDDDSTKIVNGGKQAVSAAMRSSGTRHAALVGVGDAQPPSLDAPFIYDAGAFDEARLRSVLDQLVRGLMALHRAKKIHRDIKPSNVLVDERGSVKILDFGLVADFGRDTIWDGIGTVGTPSYMSPEQVEDKPLTPASDWYALGCLLYRALTGYPIYSGTVEQIMYQKVHVDAPSPAALVDGLPPDLVALCDDLLRRDPQKRPTGRQIIARLQSDEPLSDNSHEATAFVGRGHELEVCARAFADARQNAVTVLVRGDSGVGKSAVVREFASRLRADDARALVLSGKCYERESVPFKAIDSVMDALCASMLAMHPSEAAAIVPTDAALVGLVFPVMHRVMAFAQAPRDSLEHQAPSALRERLFAAVRELFTRLAALRSVALVIDDLQWTDDDSLALLRELVEPESGAPLLLLATVRTGAELLDTERSEARIELPGDVRELVVGGLPANEAAELASLVLAAMGSDDAPGSWQDVGAIASEAAGHPLFIGELVRHNARASHPSQKLRLEDALQARLERLRPDATAVLELLAMAACPLPLDVVAHAASVTRGALMQALAELRGARLVRTSGARASDRVEVYHDRIRAAVHRELDVPTQRGLHHALAWALEASGSSEPDTLGLHWGEAGDAERAIRYCLLAAESSTAVYAFHHAARAYERALAFLAEDDPRWLEVQWKRADALNYAGKALLAAEAYLLVANKAKGDASLTARRLGAQQLMGSGHFARGLEEMKVALALIGHSVPETPVGAVASLLFRRAHLKLRGFDFRPRPAIDVPQSELTRADVVWSATMGFGIIDAVRTTDFQTRAILVALQVGEPERVCRALATEIMVEAVRGAAGRKRTAELIALMKQLVEQYNVRPAIHALYTSTHGMVAHLDGRFKDVGALMAASEAMYGKDYSDTTRYELDTQRIMLWGAKGWLGHVRDFHALAPRLIRDAVERQNSYLATNLRSGIHAIQWLAHDKVDVAKHNAETSIAGWPQEQAHMPRLLTVGAFAQIAMYEDRAADAHQEVLRWWTRLQVSLLLTCQYLRVYLRDLRARAALARAVSDRKDKTRWLREAESEGHKLRRECEPWPDGLGAIVLAGVAAQRGRPDRALALTREALARFEECELQLHVATACAVLARLDGGDTGAALLARSASIMHNETVRVPERIARLLAPGLLE